MRVTEIRVETVDNPFKVCLFDMAIQKEFNVCPHADFRQVTITFDNKLVLDEIWMKCYDKVNKDFPVGKFINIDFQSKEEFEDYYDNATSLSFASNVNTKCINISCMNA